MISHLLPSIETFSLRCILFNDFHVSVIFIQHLKSKQYADTLVTKHRIVLNVIFFSGTSSSSSSFSLRYLFSDAINNIWILNFIYRRRIVLSIVYLHWKFILLLLACTMHTAYTPSHCAVSIACSLFTVHDDFELFMMKWYLSWAFNPGMLWN